MKCWMKFCLIHKMLAPFTPLDAFRLKVGMCVLDDSCNISYLNIHHFWVNQCSPLVAPIQLYTIGSVTNNNNNCCIPKKLVITIINQTLHYDISRFLTQIWGNVIFHIYFIKNSVYFKFNDIILLFISFTIKITQWF